MSKIAEEILRDLIDKHLEFKSGLETTSIQYYAEYGKVSGSMYLNVKRLCEEYASQQLAEKDKEIERLKRRKLVHQLFIGKVADILSVEKVQELLRESNESLNKMI